jgi:hypothetical protein
MNVLLIFIDLFEILSFYKLGIRYIDVSEYFLKYYMSESFLIIPKGDI